MSLEGNTDDSVDALIRDLAATAPNVTSIDIRKIVTRVIEVIDGAVLASLAVAATLLAAGALSLASVVAADVDARRREALAFVLIGASRMEVAMARLGEGRLRRCAGCGAWRDCGASGWVLARAAGASSRLVAGGGIHCPAASAWRSVGPGCWCRRRTRRSAARAWTGRAAAHFLNL